MSTPIVVGTDGSPPATAAVIWAAEEAARRSLPLRIVHVTEPWSYGTPYYPAPGVLDQLAESEKRIALDAAELVRERRPALEIETKIVHGPIAEKLREQSPEAFEVVVGHRGFGGFAGLLLGAVSLRVAGHTDGPVVVVCGDGTDDHGEIVVGIDLADDPSIVLGYAFDAATVRGARVRVVHAWPLPVVTGDYVDTPATLAEIERAVQAAIGRAVEPWQERYPDVKVVEELVRDHPVHALAKASAQADLVIVGSRRRNGLGLMNLGSVGHGLVHHADCPVLIARPRS
jgi:Universal stress protein UspA and related nucleotide-binding proteins